MKKINFAKIFCYTLVLGFIVILTGCESGDTLHLEWLDKGETVYAGKIDSVAIHGGNKRVNIEANVSVNNLEKLVVYWNNNNDSISVPVNEQTGFFDVTIENLLEQTYVFNIVSVDIFGNRSLPVESVGTVYGDFYQSTLANRVSTSLSLSGTDFILEFEPSAEDVEFVEVVYVNTDDVTVTARLEADEEALTFQNYKSGLKHRTVYKPNALALDLFYTDYKENNFSILLNYSNWSIVDFSTEHNSSSNGVNNFIDGTWETRWHSRAGRSSYPHYATVDMGAIYTVSKFSLARTTYDAPDGDDRGPDVFQIEISLDNVSWTSLGEWNFNRSQNGWQDYLVDSVITARYFRYTALEGPQNNHVMGGIIAYN